MGLALEVRRIEQQLSKMNASIGDAQSMLARSVRSEESPVKQTKRYTGLAGKVSQLAKQIVRTVVALNLTSFSHPKVHSAVYFSYIISRDSFWYVSYLRSKMFVLSVFDQTTS